MSAHLLLAFQAALSGHHHGPLPEPIPQMLALWHSLHTAPLGAKIILGTLGGHTVHTQWRHGHALRDGPTFPLHGDADAWRRALAGLEAHQAGQRAIPPSDPGWTHANHTTTLRGQDRQATLLFHGTAWVTAHTLLTSQPVVAVAP